MAGIKQNDRAELPGKGDKRMNPKDKMDIARAGMKPVINRKSNAVINGVKISREARKLATSCLLHHGIDITSPNADTQNGGIMPKDKFLRAIHELANNSRITNNALVDSMIKKVNSLEGVTQEALECLMSLAQHAVDQQVSAELTLSSLELLTGKLDSQFKAVSKIKGKIDHLHVDKLADDLDKLAQAVSNPLVAKLLGLDGEPNE